MSRHKNHWFNVNWTGFHVHLLRCYTNLLAARSIGALAGRHFAPESYGDFAPPGDLENPRNPRNWWVQWVPHILSDRIMSSSHFRFPDPSEIRVTKSRHGWPEVTEADLALSLLPLSLRRLPPRRRLTGFVWIHTVHTPSVKTLENKWLI